MRTSEFECGRTGPWWRKGPATLAVVVALGGVWPTRTLAADGVAPGRIIVKFRDALTANAADLLANGQPFAAALTDGSDSLDQLNKEIGVTAASEVFFPHRGMSTSQARAAFQQQVDAMMSRFPRRTARIAPGTPPPPDLTNIYTLTIPADEDPELVCGRYAADPNVHWCQPDYVMTTRDVAGDSYRIPEPSGQAGAALPATYTVPNDPYYLSSGSWGQPYPDLWGLKSIRADRVWSTTQGEGVTVAVVDSGVDVSHPDIAANVIPGWDFIVGDAVPRDPNGHGTHVAGTIAAVGNNGMGIIGVAPRAQIMPMRALDSTGSGLASTLATALHFATRQGAEVINNSWGCEQRCFSQPVIEGAVTEAVDLGVAVVFAAGNGADDVFYYSPQNMTGRDKPIVVAANDRRLKAAVFPTNQGTRGTNYGATVDVSAPGGGEQDLSGVQDPSDNILSLKASQCDATAQNSVCPPQLVVGDRYLRLRGTSMAAPHVSGLVALLLSPNRSSGHPVLKPEDVRHLLQMSGRKRRPDGTRIGFGQVDAPGALSLPAPLIARLSAPGRLRTFNPNAPVAVRGSAGGDNFWQWRLSYGIGSAPLRWKLIARRTQPVSDNLLASWDVSGLSSGVYTLQLLVLGRSGRSVAEVQPVIIDQAIRLTGDDTRSYGHPSIGGDFVAADARPAAGGPTLGIALISISSRVESLVGTPGSASPAFDLQNPDRLVYTRQENGVPEIYLHTISSGADAPITTVGGGDRFAPRIDGDRVVWVDTRDGSPQIYAYDLGSHSEQRLTDGSSQFVAPSVSGNTAVWQQGNQLPLPLGLSLYDFTTGTPHRALTGDPRAAAACPSIGGDWIPWTQYTKYWNPTQVYAYNAATMEVCQLTLPTTPGFLHGCTAISNDLVVWLAVPPPAVLAYDLQHNTGPTQLSNPFSTPTGSAVSPQWVAWTARESETDQVFIHPRP